MAAPAVFLKSNPATHMCRRVAVRLGDFVNNKYPNNRLSATAGESAFDVNAELIFFFNAFSAAQEAAKRLRNLH